MNSTEAGAAPKRTQVEICVSDSAEVIEAKLTTAGVEPVEAKATATELAARLATVARRAGCPFGLSLPPRRHRASPVAVRETPAIAAAGCRVPCGRNDPCPCASGAKFKRCHGRAAAAANRGGVR